MKKRLLLLAITVFILLTAAEITLLAADVTEPRANVATTTTNISIFSPGSVHSAGRAIINLRYTGYPDITESAEITLKIEKKLAFFFVKESVSQTYQTNDIYHMNKLEYPLEETGTYRFTVIYRISGKGGETDVIRITEEKIYDPSCPPFPLLHKTENVLHDCTSEDCCENCFRILGASPRTAHTSDGNRKLYDNVSHYSCCINNTVSTSICHQLIKEAHQYDGDGRCIDCGYRRPVCTEEYDANAKIVHVTVWADGAIRAYLDKAWLEPSNYQILQIENTSWLISISSENRITLHIPLEKYLPLRKNGLELYLFSRERGFYFTVYPTLDPFTS